MKTVLLLFGLFLGFLANAQDLTGVWRGQFRSNDRMMQLMNVDNRYKFEVQIDQRGKSFNGVTYSYKTTEFYGKANARGTIHTGTQKVILEELKIVEVRMAKGNDACIMTCFLQYSKNEEEEFLEGYYVSMNTRDSTDCGRGTVFLRKVPESDFYKEPFLVNREKGKEKPRSSGNDTSKKAPSAKADSAVTVKAKSSPKKAPPSSSGKPVAKAAPKKPVTKPPPPDRQGRPIEAKPVPEADSEKTAAKKTPPPPVIVPPVLKNRENEVIKTFNVTTRNITVNLYDNGTIDNDTVSVYLNKRLIVSKKMLSLSPIVINIELDDDNNYQELVMVAENLGDIPPNTSLMVVKAGNQQFEARITSTEQKNAVVIFKYEKSQ
ncbi:hypothetical protein [Flavihumibacter petaseus]|uniref:Lipocalin-like domain-containing protein n=1 Tax=Flavihumibacter petaseus NBRC 106054 TaxID=1220578 RepID=A0A0E9N756_9BACT|nr:hypothetical protein [Flavihumibacter petaseus]GAO45659.1 hypothetical protein FPE01S_07_00470 [Flavihumibacter petaseus NBRC 106054]